MSKKAMTFLMMLLLSKYAQSSELNLLSNAELDIHYQTIQKALVRDRNDSYWWQHGWETAYGASSIIQTAKALAANNSDNEVRFGVGAAKSLIAFSVMYTNPLPALSSEMIEEEPANNKLEKISRIKRAEQQLRQRADVANNIHTWKRHGSAILFNLSTSAIISIFGDNKDAIASAIGGILASEINIWTQPSGALEDWENYQKQNASKVSWLLLPTANGIALNVRF